jgi:hypothetical protein
MTHPRSHNRWSIVTARAQEAHRKFLTCGGREQAQDTMEKPEGVGGDSTDLKAL